MKYKEQKKKRNTLEGWKERDMRYEEEIYNNFIYTTPIKYELFTSTKK
jgi:hypothetical protein